MIERTTDVGLLNRLVGRDFEGADFSEVLAEPLHVCLIEDESAAIFMWRGPGIYEYHVSYGVRGKAAIDLAHRMFEIMRHTYKARLIWSLVPVESRHVQIFARLIGLRSDGVRQTRFGPQELFVSERTLCLQA